MNDQSESEEHLKQNDVPATKLNSSHEENETKNFDAPSSSQSEVKSKKGNETVSTTDEVRADTELCSNEVEKDQSKLLINETPIILEAICENQINEKIETFKQKTFKLPTESEAGGFCSKPDVVGDDFSKKSEVRILCECEPNVAGAAVPAMKSFTPTENQNLTIKCNKSKCNMNGTGASEPIQDNRVLKNKELAKPLSKIGQKIKDEKEKNYSNSANRSFHQMNQCFKPTVEKVNPDAKGHTKKPSLIPKPTRPSTSTHKNIDKEGIDKRDAVTRSRTKLESQKHPTKSSVKIKEASTDQLLKNNQKTINTSLEKLLDSGVTSNSTTISSRMIGLQERLKATTSMLRQKIELDKSKEKNAPEESCIDLVVEEEINKNVSASTKTVDDLYKNIFSLKDIASTLSENNTLKNQTKYIEKLFKNISEIKLIADKLCMHDQSRSEDDNFNGNIAMEKQKTPQSSSTNAKDNKIYIKFMHSKDRKCDNKKKTKELFTEPCDEVQPNLSLSSKLTSDSLDSDTCITQKSQEENKVKEADSMDGVFIPSCEPPKNMEDEEETNGLDITITFPEFSQFYTNGAESHLSVCLSDISAEALKKLKRCPKDFTLKMDFVEGKVLFQSGKSPANNFQIGPDLKFAENIVDTKKSDVISIKPSTECSYGSQLIPVENARENKSYKSLKSTDSELFNVVSLPFLYKNPYLATNHKSCITFRNDQLISMAILAKHIYKSMPQIPSLTNIFEDKLMESPSKTDTRKETQKSPESEKMDYC